MEPKIVSIGKIKTVGMRLKHSLSNNQTISLWKKFMPRKKEIKNLKNVWYYAIQLYDNDAKMENFTTNTKFETWAAVEVSDFELIPKEMESHIIEGGKYAMFIQKGDAVAFQKLMNYIFGTWLPNSEFTLNNGEHFQIMKEKYLGENNPNSEEEVWIPIK